MTEKDVPKNTAKITKISGELRESLVGAAGEEEPEEKD